MPSSRFSAVIPCLLNDHWMLRELASVSRSPPKNTGEMRVGPFGTYLQRMNKMKNLMHKMKNVMNRHTSLVYYLNCFQIRNLLVLQLEQYVSQFGGYIFTFEKKTQGMLRTKTYRYYVFCFVNMQVDYTSHEGICLRSMFCLAEQ